MGTRRISSRALSTRMMARLSLLMVAAVIAVSAWTAAAMYRVDPVSGKRIYLAAPRIIPKPQPPACDRHPLSRSQSQVRTLRMWCRKARTVFSKSCFGECHSWCQAYGFDAALVQCHRLSNLVYLAVDYREAEAGIDSLDNQVREAVPALEQSKTRQARLSAALAVQRGEQAAQRRRTTDDEPGARSVTMADFEAEYGFGLAADCVVARRFKDCISDPERAEAYEGLFSEYQSRQQQMESLAQQLRAVGEELDGFAQLESAFNAAVAKRSALKKQYRAILDQLLAAAGTVGDSINGELLSQYREQ
eukprot:gnl/Hemi2/13383_TR4596_c0_g1_i1.p1 gnl/Hemi2/13383_TR4596_c0_g1~~gnl/Hemi2/13383_TR4596_c0_g1_i1.p1  ORF type:complete len:305 (+),score=57.57 gnl/Hemi2/13383_TR4596_c0_g1_i1:35-949(+)